MFVGDLIDRGSESKEVMDFVRENKYKSVKGNHEDMFIKKEARWLIYGGKDTKESFKGLTKKEINKYREWADKLPEIIKYEIKGEKPLYITHSSINLFKTDEEIIKNNSIASILWKRKIKEEFNLAVNIHGHTIVKKENMRETGSHINIDNGIYSGGSLTAIQYPSLRRIYHNKEKIDKSL